MAVPVDAGGTWVDVATSARPVAQALRALAGGDPSVALVSAMHPAVLDYWLAAPELSNPAWKAQWSAVVASAVRGRPVGTITSEPGSGGDIAKTRSVAPNDGDLEPFLDGTTYRVTGAKHFGSGSGICERMITTAVAEGEDTPTVFVLDTARADRGSPPTTSELIAEWDGMGIRATQSHALRLEGTPAVRLATERPMDQITGAAMPPSRRTSSPSCSACSTRPSPPPGPRSRTEPTLCGPTSGSSGRGRAGPLAGGPGPRRRPASPRVGERRRRRARRPSGQAVHRRAGRTDPPAPRPGPGRRHLLAALRPSVTGWRTSAPSASSARRGAWPTYGCSPPRWTKPSGDPPKVG